jgi:prepilin signal peptidase PulO-like enzyme (type II secretory pathway)
LSGSGFLILVAIFGKAILKKDAMGGGDIKFMFWIGAMFGFETAMSAIFIGSVTGTIISVFLILLGKTKSETYIPFSPYLCVGVLVSTIFDDRIRLIFSLN